MRSNLVDDPVVELGRLGRRVPDDLLRMLEGLPVRQIRGESAVAQNVRQGAPPRSPAA